jgi:hypothetical protein
MVREFVMGWSCQEHKQIDFSKKCSGSQQQENGVLEAAGQCREMNKAFK